MKELKGMTFEESAVFEWQFGLCGGFKKALWEAICRADDSNLDLLALGFPVEVEGYKIYTRESGWWEKVKDKAHKLGYLSDGQD